MGLRVNVKDGTNAGWRRLGDARGDWTCPKGHLNLGRHLRCMTRGCNRKRDRR